MKITTIIELGDKSTIRYMANFNGLEEIDKIISKAIFNLFPNV